MISPQEKLKEIREKLNEGVIELGMDAFEPQDIEWIIARVEQLEAFAEAVSPSWLPEGVREMRNALNTGPKPE